MNDDCREAFFPFYTVTDFEFEILNSRNSRSDNFERCAEHLSPSKLANLSSNNNDFFLVHFNARSLPKNVDKLEEVLTEMTSLPIAISETKLNSNSYSNISIPNYNFFHSDSPTLASGVGRYLKDTLKYSLRNSLSLNVPHCEDLWLEVHCKNSNFILGVIYLHPNQNFSSFQDTLHNQLYDFESNKLNYVVCGDININTLAKNTKIIEYIEKLDSIGCKELVDAPTRLASTVNCNSSLLDHVYTNMPKKTLSGVCLFELSDHLPTFVIIPNTKSHVTNKPKYKRCMKNFDLECQQINYKL